MKIRHFPPSLRTQKGIGMIEVMVAIVVVAIGFLGMAALQAKALATNNSAMSRSMATTASYSILDAMRADATSADGGSYNTTVTATSCPTIGTTLASVNLSIWCQQLSQGLGPVSTTTGTIQCASSGYCSVTIQFDDSRAGDGGSATQQVVTYASI